MKFNKKMICLLCVAAIATSSLTMFGCHSKDNKGSSSSSSSQSEIKTDNKSEFRSGQLRLKLNADEKKALYSQLTGFDNKGHLLASLLLLGDYYPTDGYKKAMEKYEASHKISDQEKSEMQDKIIENINNNSNSSSAKESNQQKSKSNVKFIEVDDSSSSSSKESDQQKSKSNVKFIEVDDSSSSSSSSAKESEEQKLEYPKSFCMKYSTTGENADFPKEYSLSNYTEKDGLVSTEKLSDGTYEGTMYNFDPRKINTYSLKTIVNLMFVSEDEYNKAQKSGDKFKDDLGNVYDKKLAQGNGLVCLASFDIPNITFDDINADGKAMYEKLKKSIENAGNNGTARIEDFETTAKSYENQQNIQTDVGDKMPSFEAEATDGSTVSNKDFANHDLTMINIWQENCSSCIAELPDLERLSKEVSSNVQVMGMLINADSDKAKENIKNIINKAGTSYKQFFANKQLDSISSDITGTPTTIFVDKNGNIVGEPIVGAKSTDEYKKIIEERLNQIKN